MTRMLCQTFRAPEDVSRRQIMKDCGKTSLTQPGRRYSLDTINRNPLRGYPSAMVLFGVETDSALLTDPVFTARLVAGRDINRPLI